MRAVERRRQKPGRPGTGLRPPRAELAEVFLRDQFKVSPVIFVASLLCFLFPFTTVSCGGQKSASFSGVQLAAGTTIEQPQPFGPAQKQKVDSEPTAAIALLCAILGAGLSFVGARFAIGTAITGVLGALSLLLMKSRLDDQILKEGHGMLQVSYETGFSLALLLLLAGAAWNAYLLWHKRGFRRYEQT